MTAQASFSQTRAIGDRVKAMEDGPVKEFPDVKSATGTLTKYRTMREVVKLDVNGKQYWAFGVAFVEKPAMGYFVVQPETGAAITVEGYEWVMNAAKNRYIGIRVRGIRDRKLPTLGALSGSLLSVATLLTPLNALFTLLSEYSTKEAAGKDVEVHLTAAPRSEPETLP